jgi:nucleotide-binding universal stress UspA family protein
MECLLTEVRHWEPQSEFEVPAALNTTARRGPDGRCNMKYIIVPVDFSDVTDRVVAVAENMARALNASLRLLHCVQAYPQIVGAGEMAPVIVPEPDVPLAERFPQQQHQLAALVSSLRDKGIDADFRLIEGLPPDEIVSFADQLDAEMIVLGSHGHGALYELMVGTVTQAVLKHTRHPVLVVPTEKYRKIKAYAAEKAAQSVMTSA